MSFLIVVGCPSQYTHATYELCYILPTSVSTKTFSNAEQACRNDYGGHLAKVTSDQQQGLMEYMIHQ